MFSGRLILSLLAIALIFSTACTRTQSDTSKMKIVLPAKMLGSQSLTSADMLGHVVINVTGDGIPMPILLTWDLCKECPNPTAPSSFSLDIPTGSNRMVQVLAVYMNTSTDKMSFYYGDNTVTLSQSQESVVVPISQLGSATNIVSGHIAGRYLTAAGSGPTGPLDIVYTPPGKPSLIVDRGFIMNGWFDVFGLAGLAFGYRLPDGSLLFGKNLDLNDPVLAPSASVLKAAVPTHMRQQNNNGSTSWNPEEAEIHVIGFFGPGVSAANAVCKPATLNSLTKIAQAGATAGSPVLTSSASAIPSVDALLNTATPLSSYYVNGGVGDSTTPCTSGTIYASFLKWAPSLIDGNGKDESSGFTVPLQWDATSLKPLAIDQSANRVISGRVLPGVQVVADGFQLFKRVATDDFQFHSGVDCFSVANGALGFVPAGSGSIVAATGDFSITSTITSTEASSGVSAVLCPTKAGALQPGGVFVNKWAFNSGGGGGGSGPGPAHHLAIIAPQSVNSYACMDVQIQVVDSNGFQTSTPSAINLDLSSLGTHSVQIMAGGPGTNCSAGTTSTFSTSIPAGSSSVWVKFKGAGINGVSDQINVSNITGSSLPATMVSTSKPFSIVSAGIITQLALDPNTQMRVNPGDCLPVVIQAKDSSFASVNVAGPTPLTVSTTAANGGTNPFQLFSDAGCAAALPNANNNVTITTSTSQVVVYMKATSTGSSHLTGVLTQNLTIDGSATNVNSTFDQWIEAVPSTDATMLALSDSFSATDAYSANCLPLNMQARNDAGTPINISGNFRLNSFNVNDSVNFYSDVGCTTPMTAGNLYPWGGGSQMTVYFKPIIAYSSTAVTFNISAEFSSTSAPQFMLRGNYQRTITPSKVVPILKVAGTVQSVPYTLSYSAGTCLEIYFELRDETNETGIPNKTGNLIGFGLDFTPSLSSTAASYTDPSCTTPIGMPQSVSIPPNSNMSNSYFIKATTNTFTNYSIITPSLNPGIHWLSTAPMFSTNN